MTWTVACTGVSAGWGAETILEADFRHDFSRDGNVLPVLGESGTGKSTLLYVIAALSRPRAGQVTWHDKSSNNEIKLAMSHEPARQAATVYFRRFSTGFALQDASLVPHLTVQENLDWILRQRDNESSNPPGRQSKDARRQRISELVGQFLSDEDKDRRLAAILNTFPSKLSGGERLRMAAAAAMIHDPPLLFADEPTGSLDRHSRQRLLHVIRRWLDKGKGGRSFIFITHEESEAAQLGASRCIRVKRRGERVIAKDEKF